MNKICAWFLLSALLDTNSAAYRLNGIENSLTSTTYSRKPVNNARLDNLARLNCDFDDSSTCAYSGTSGQWKILSGTVQSVQPWRRIFNTSSTPNPPFVGVELDENETPFAVLASDTLQCADEKGVEVVFNFWASKGVELQVCLTRIPDGEQIACSQKFSSNTASYPVFLSYKHRKAVQQQFRVEYMAMLVGEASGLLLLDDLAYFGKTCSSGSTLGSDQKTKSPADDNQKYVNHQISWTNVSKKSRLVNYSQSVFGDSELERGREEQGRVKYASACEILRCDFETSDCGFTSKEGGVVWQRSQAKLTNDLADQANNFGSNFLQNIGNIIQPSCVGEQCQIFSDNNAGFYTSVTLEPSMFQYEVAVLSSPMFKKSAGQQLNFKFFRSMLGQTIRVCFEERDGQFENIHDFKQCPSQIPPYNLLTDSSWRSFSVDIPSNAYKAYIVAYLEFQIWFNAPIAIDKIAASPC